MMPVAWMLIVDTANDVKMVNRLGEKKRGMKNLGPSKWK